MPGAGTGSAVSPVMPLSLPPSGSGNGGVTNGAYPTIQLRSSSRAGYSSSVRGTRDERGGGREGREERGKKNPLSIGSIISDETG